MKRWIILWLMVLACLLSGCGGETDALEVPDSNGDGKLSCTLEIRCDTLLDHLDELSEGKAALVPADGEILSRREVEFQAGDTVFDIFREVLREEQIHFEYIDAKAYGSAYIEGIANLYEFDCGPQSGWMFSVNGEHLGLGSSGYTLADGDRVMFSYTCDLGADLGAEYEE